MTGFTLDECARLSIELALTANSHDRLQREQQDTRAKALGMTGAEIDAARSGKSFDVRTSAVLALAMASNDDDERRRGQRARALKAGITEDVCFEIEALANRFAVVKKTI
jgi:hypothetical protein